MRLFYFSNFLRDLLNSILCFNNLGLFKYFQPRGFDRSHHHRNITSSRFDWSNNDGSLLCLLGQNDWLVVLGFN